MREVAAATAVREAREAISEMEPPEGAMVEGTAEEVRARYMQQIG